MMTFHEIVMLFDYTLFTFSADMMTNPLEVDDKESTRSISSSTSRHSDAQKSTLEKAKLKDQVSL